MGKAVVPRLASMVLGLSFAFAVYFVSGNSQSVETTSNAISRELASLWENQPGFSRKLLAFGDGSGEEEDDDDGGSSSFNRAGWGCSKDNVVIFQGPTSPLPNGIPTYTVQIQNVCVTGCRVFNLHLNCGWFSSARLINPRIFRRIFFNDCLVNDGGSLNPGESLSFQYANTFPYPLSVSSLSCF